VKYKLTVPFSATALIKLFSLIFFCCFINNSSVTGQVRFSQFYASPLLINPAHTGRFNNKSYRIGGAFRREVNPQEKIYTQSTLFLDSKILNKIAPENDCFAIGILGLAEKSETEGIKNTYLSVSAAYQKALDDEGKQQLGIGFQTTFARRKLQKPNLIFEDQVISWLNSGYTNIDIFQLGNVDVTYTDLNAGLVYQGRLNSNNFFAAGVSMYHITKPSRTFQGGELNLSRQVWSHLAWEKNMPDEKKIYAALLISYSDKSVNDLFAGLTCQIKINKNNQFIGGAWLRNTAFRGTSITPSIGLNFKGFTINTSYDVNITSKNTNQKGATEISLIYSNPLSRRKSNENKFIRF
jgi:type IX secretion system PorP/SprF family membrane protein